MNDERSVEREERQELCPLHTRVEFRNLNDKENGLYKKGVYEY